MVVDSVVDEAVASARGVAQEVAGEVSEDAAKRFETDFLWRSGAIGMLGLTFGLDVEKDVLLTSSLHFFVKYIYYPSTCSRELVQSATVLLGNGEFCIEPTKLQY